MTAQRRKLLYVFGGVLGAAAVLAVVLVVVSSGGGEKTTTTTAAVTPSTATELFKGLPQKGAVLGATSGAPMLTEYADLQCPYCSDLAKNVLPTVVDEYVRTGKMNVTFNGMAFIGPDSVKALQAVYAAGLQNHLWEVLDSLYTHQGAENSGWVTDELLTQIGSGIPGFDLEKWRSDMSSSEVQQQIAQASDKATANGVSSTPTLFLDATRLELTGLTPADFRGAVDPLLSD